MRFWKKLKHFFAAKEVRLDYSAETDAKLIELWNKKHQLTEDAKTILEQEGKKRNLAAFLEPISHEPLLYSDWESQPHFLEKRNHKNITPLEKPRILIAQGLGVLLECNKNELILCIFPHWNATITPVFPELQPNDKVVTIIICNQDHTGFLMLEKGLSHWQVSTENIYYLDETADTSSLELKQKKENDQIFPKFLSKNQILIQRLEQGYGLEISWSHKDQFVAFVGTQIPYALLQNMNDIFMIGGFSHTEIHNPLAQQKQLDDIISMMMNRIKSNSTSVILFNLDWAGVSPESEAFLDLLHSIGMETSHIGQENPNSKETDTNSHETKPTNTEFQIFLKLILHHHWDQVEEKIKSADQVQQIVEYLLIINQFAEAEQLLLFAQKKLGENQGILWLQRGVCAELQGLSEKIIEFYEKAAYCTIPEPRAFVNLSCQYAFKEDPVKSLSFAQQAIDLLPNDTVASFNFLLALWRNGKTALAQQMYLEKKLLLSERMVGLLSNAFKKPYQPGKTTFHNPPFLYLAEKAYTLAIEAEKEQKIDIAIQLWRRCIALNPLHIEAILDVGATLSKQGNDQEALTLYEQTLTIAPQMTLIRFNRANCFLRLGQLELALSEYQICAQELPHWPAPHVQQASIYLLKKDFFKAHQEILILKKLGASDDLIQSLQNQIL